ncbi:MAG: type IV pilus modification protein PilV [Proteobacteria bacterium]|nr:type IV pilus modification protein PilV [Pseudomonadota bacterium]
MSFKLHPSPASSGGFSLVEVLIALAVLSIGLLGVAKIQALGLSSTAVAGKRALAAIAADSLAASMHENEGYWTSTSAIPTGPIGTTTYTGPVAPATWCWKAKAGYTGPCTPAQLANYDLQNWASSLAQLLPNYQAIVTCALNGVTTCTITIQWYEKTLAVNAQGTGAAVTQNAATNAPTYTLFVQP